MVTYVEIQEYIYIYIFFFSQLVYTLYIHCTGESPYLQACILLSSQSCCEWGGSSPQSSERPRGVRRHLSVGADVVFYVTSQLLSHAAPRRALVAHAAWSPSRYPAVAESSGASTGWVVGAACACRLVSVHPLGGA